MERKDIDILRNCKRKIQRAYIDHERNKKYLLQTEVQYEQMENFLKQTHCLFITHDNDGGTRVFENANKHKYAPVVVLRRLRHAFMEDNFFSIEVIVSGKELHYLIKLEELKKIFQNEYQMIIVNSLVTYQCYDIVLGLLIEYKKMHSNCTIQYFVHDYHSVCPNENLHSNEWYCYLKCSENNCELYNGKCPVYIQEWRNIWNGFWDVVDEIRCFSESSKKIIENAYPLIGKSKVVVKPHDTTYCVCNPIPKQDSLPLCIGFVGAVYTSEKGKNVVSNVVKRYGDHIAIRIIGAKAWRYGIFRRKVKYIGPYKREKLREILIEQNVSVVIFPSLCPETFSYLISELMALDITIVCFNFGAQAEKIERYSKGVICNNLEELYQLIEQYEKEKVQNNFIGV